MKNRSIIQKDHWRTPKWLYDELNYKYNFNFDPCPYMHDINKWDGLNIEWKERNFINPPYSKVLKNKFILKALEESKKGKLCVMLLPVSTSTKIFHEIILPNCEIIYIRKRIQFNGINSNGKTVGKGSNPQHDSMIIIFKNGTH